MHSRITQPNLVTGTTNVLARHFNQQLTRQAMSESWNYYGTVARFGLRENQCYMSVEECYRSSFEGLNQFSLNAGDPAGRKVHFLTYDYTKVSDVHCLINTSILTGSVGTTFESVKADVIISLKSVNVFKIKQKVYRYSAYIDVAQRLAITQISSDEIQVMDESINIAYSDTIPTDGRIDYETYQTSFYGSIVFFRKVDVFSYLQNDGMLLPFWRTKVNNTLIHFYPRCETLAEWISDGKLLRYSDFLDLFVRLGGVTHGDIQIPNLVFRNYEGIKPMLLTIDNHNIDGGRYFRTNARYYLHTREPQVFKNLNDSSADLYAMVRLLCDLNGSFTVEGDDSVSTFFIDDNGILSKTGTIMINLKSNDMDVLKDALTTLRGSARVDIDKEIDDIFQTTLHHTKSEVTPVYRDEILACRTVTPTRMQLNSFSNVTVDQYSLCESYLSLNSIAPSIISSNF